MFATNAKNKWIWFWAIKVLERADERVGIIGTAISIKTLEICLESLGL